MKLSDYGEFVNELEMTALGKQAAAILRNLENDRDEAVRQLTESRGRFGDMEARVVELEAVIQKVRDELGTVRDTSIKGGWAFRVAESLLNDLSSVPSVVLADHDAAVWDQGWDAAEPFIEWCQEAVDVPNPYRGDN